MNIAVKQLTVEQSQGQIHFAAAVGQRAQPSSPRNDEHDAKRNEDRAVGDQAKRKR